MINLQYIEETYLNDVKVYECVFHELPVPDAFRNAEGNG